MHTPKTKRKYASKGAVGPLALNSPRAAAEIKHAMGEVLTVLERDLSVVDPKGIHWDTLWLPVFLDPETGGLLLGAHVEVDV